MKFKKLMSLCHSSSLLFLGVLLTLIAAKSFSEVRLEKEVKITGAGLFFDGKKEGKHEPNNNRESYDFFYGQRVTPHGDCIKKFEEFVFMTWYKGGKENRHVMLTRYNTLTGSMKTIEFSHQHTGFNNKWWIGESHNTIAIGISPINGTIHLLYDMHAYHKTRPSDGSLKDDYFRYSYLKAGAATVSDEAFTLEQFVIDADNDYKHLSLTGKVDHEAFSGLTYPTFFLNTDDELLMYMRKGENNNGGYRFAKYLADKQTWSDFTQFNVLNASKLGNAYDWGLYGNMKYVNGKLRVGFQQRANIQNDKYKYQNGFYYAYSDSPDGSSDWKNHQGKTFELPLVNSDKIKVSEPGDLVGEADVDQVYIVQGFDWNVTKRGDVHIIGKVRHYGTNRQISVHTYKPAGKKSFTTTTDFAGADKIYTAGNVIYVIGLTERGHPYVEKAAGGTNDFSRIYHAHSGKCFRHGSVYIHEGKLYYYLMQNESGTKQPIYLQVINLDID